MQFTREISTLLLTLIAGLLVITLSASYWAIMGPDTILEREDNARLFEDEASILRGSIYDRNGTLLVSSAYDEDDILIRAYHLPSMYSVLGYYSLRYGVGGAESAFDAILSGDNLEYDMSTYLQQDILHIPQEGSALQLTFDESIQQAIIEDLGNATGAVILQSVPEGEIIAMVSQPSINPNTLDANWETLVEDDTQPFFNRALQGNYQPGGILYLAIMAGGLSNGYDLTQIIEDATQSITLSDVTISCLHEESNTTLTISNAFILGCPYPMTTVAEEIGLTRIQPILNRFLIPPPTNLQNFVSEPIGDELPATTPEVTEEVQLLTLADVLGQGEITITPISLNLVTSALINNGNAPQPYVLLATRPPNDDEWVDVDISRQSIPIMTEATANYIRNLLIESTEQISDEFTIGGYTAIAFTGEQINSWFIGFISTPNNTGFAITVLLERTDDITLAQEIGINALTTAVENIEIMSTD